MQKFLILYLSPTPAREEVSNRSPEEAKAGKDAWLQWAKQAGSAIVELGAPLADAGSTKSKVTGFTIMQANNARDLEPLLRDHPHTKHPGATLEIHEFLDVPGMSQGSGERELAYSR